MISDPNKPTAIAKRFNILAKKYEAHKKKAFLSFNSGKFDVDLLDETEKLKSEITALTENIYYSANFVIPDNELTKH